MKKLVIAVLFILCFVMGAVAGIYEYNENEFIRKLFESFEEDLPIPTFYKDMKTIDESEKQPDFTFEEIDPFHRVTDVSKLIDIKNEKDIIEKREKLIEYIWKKKDFPYSKMPDKIEKGVKIQEYESLNKMENLKSIDKLTVSMECGFKSYICLFHPLKSSGKFIICQQGHSKDYLNRTIQYFLKKGYTVMGLLMPGFGLNNKPIVDIPRLGKLRMKSHSYYLMLDSDNFCAFRIFLEPVAACVNYTIKELGFNTIYMVGLSGGGWTTTIYSAIDTRITKSYPVAGTYPIFVREKRDWGDYEQFFPWIYKIANYLELYIMGAYERRQYQLLNKYDSCCFAGYESQLYEREVKEVLSRLGKGKFDVFIDDSHKKHQISDIHLDIIYNDIEGNI